jgi:hypothetical protein
MAGQLRIGFIENESNTDAFSHAVQITLSGAGLPDGTYRLDELADTTTTKNGISVYTIPAAASGDPVKGMHMKVTVDPQAGNELQGASGGFTLQADLRQSNSDGRGDSAGQDQTFPAKPATATSQP